MAIKIGENPEGFPNINKFIARGGEGQRGRIVAIRKGGKEAIVMAANTSFNPRDVRWGNMYLIREKNANEYPRVVKKIRGIPNTKKWRMILK